MRSPAHGVAAAAIAMIALSLTACGSDSSDGPASPPPSKLKPGCLAVDPAVVEHISSKVKVDSPMGKPVGYAATELDSIWIVVAGLEGAAGGAAAVWAIGDDPSKASSASADVISVDSTAKEFSTWPTDDNAVPPKTPSINAAIACL